MTQHPIRTRRRGAGAPSGRACVLALLLGVAGLSGAPAHAARLSKKSGDWLVQRLDAAPAGPQRLALATELARRRDPALLPALVRAAGDPERAVRLVALEGLAAYGPAVADPQRDRAFLAALEGGDPAAMQIARDALRDRLLAATEPGLARIHDQLGLLARRSEAWRGRKACVGLLAPIAGPAPAAVLVEVAGHDPHPEVRRAAAEALGARGAAGARPVLSRLRRADPDPQVRLAAERALAQLGGPATEAVLAVMPFDTNDPLLRESVAALQHTFTTRLALAGHGRVVERAQLERVFDELRYQDRAIDDGRAVTVGAQLRATDVVTGVLQRAGDEVRCLAKRIDVATGEVTAAPPVVGGLHDLAALQQACADRLARSL